MENKVMSRKRPRKKSRIALDSDEPMEFPLKDAESRFWTVQPREPKTINSCNKKPHQQQEKGNQKEKKTRKKTQDTNSQQKGNKREAMKNKKIAR